MPFKLGEEQKERLAVARKAVLDIKQTAKPEEIKSVCKTYCNVFEGSERFKKYGVTKTPKKTAKKAKK